MVSIQSPKKEESEWLRGEDDEIKFIDFMFERWQVFDARSRFRSYLYLISLA